MMGVEDNFSTKQLLELPEKKLKMLKKNRSI